ncbi:hypothetical protein ACQKFG_04820 [Peribacillus sp. NPDC076916]|uniref:hypothetical protein n=1 Tax=Peribacillus sp. NPDC076916 TaxID=3390608 RepID=UPI003CFE381D
MLIRLNLTGTGYKLQLGGNRCEQNADQVLDVAIVSFKQLIGKMKRSRVRDAFGYFYGILDKKFNNIFYDELFKLGIQNSG